MNKIFKNFMYSSGLSGERDFNKFEKIIAITALISLLIAILTTKQ